MPLAVTNAERKTRMRIRPNLIEWITSPYDSVNYALVKEDGSSRLHLVATFPEMNDAGMLMDRFLLEEGERIVCLKKHEDGSLQVWGQRLFQNKRTTGYASLY
jgi:hypothetical protein